MPADNSVENFSSLAAERTTFPSFFLWIDSSNRTEIFRCLLEMVSAILGNELSVSDTVSLTGKGMFTVQSLSSGHCHLIQDRIDSIWKFTLSLHLSRTTEVP